MILFVSALDAAQEMVSILPSIGIDDVIRKPVDSDDNCCKAIILSHSLSRYIS